MTERSLRLARVVSVGAATIISLACGTNVRANGMLERSWTLMIGQYVYSAWAPQFAERLKLSSTESNLIVQSSEQHWRTSGLIVL